MRDTLDHGDYPDLETRPEDVFREFIADAKRAYNWLRDAGIPDEDARFVLPNATPIWRLISANFRQLRHIIALRGTEVAQWEIRQVAMKMEAQLYDIAPHVFAAS